MNDPGGGAGGTPSVRITVEGEPTQEGVVQGGIVHEGNSEDGERGIPNVTIDMGCDVRKVRLGVDPDTCNLAVGEIVSNTNVQMFEDDDRASDDTNSNTNTSGWNRRVEALTIIVGYNSIDDLTKTKASVDFKMADFTGGGPVYDGSNAQEECWAKHTIAPFFYHMDSCTLRGRHRHQEVAPRVAHHALDLTLVVALAGTAEAVIEPVVRLQLCERTGALAPAVAQ